jgi:DNA-dependent protein kinase catalytic subunit
MPFGLLRKTLLRLSKSYDFYLHIKNQFLSNYAVVCIVGYILGIGDRHLENFLIHGSSASVIMIDFGYSFGSSRDLAVPELIPFRLTKCFMEIMEPIGYEGIFKDSMISAFSAFQDNKNIIIDFCDVFIDDPLMEWIWKCKKENPSLPVASEAVSVTISQEPPERKIYSKRIDYVEKKLIGQHPRKILVEELIQSNHKQANFMGEFKKAIWKNSKTKLERRK